MYPYASAPTLNPSDRITVPDTFTLPRLFPRIVLLLGISHIGVPAIAADAPTRIAPPHQDYSRPSLPAVAHKVAPLSREEVIAILDRYDADVKRLGEALDERDSSGNPTASSHRAALALEQICPREALPFMVRYITYGPEYSTGAILRPIVANHRYLQEVIENHGEAGAQMILRQLRDRDDQGVTPKELRFYAYAILCVDGFNRERASARLDKFEKTAGTSPTLKRLRKAIADEPAIP